MSNLGRWWLRPLMLGSFMAIALGVATAQITINDIGTINGRGSAGVGINRAGDVAGISDFTGMVGTPNGIPSEIFLNHGILFRGGVLRDLGAVEGRSGCAPEGCQSEMFAVNDADWVAGRTDNGPLGWLPVVWLPAAAPGLSAGFNVLPPLDPNHGAWANAINNARQVVGQSVLGGGFRAMLWQLTPAGPTLTDLGTLHSGNLGSAIAYSINDAGQIAGAAADENLVQQGFLYLPQAAYGLPAGMNNLTPNSQFGADARGINRRGE